MDSSGSLAALLDAFEEPTLIVRLGLVDLANRAARALLGEAIAGRDLRLAIRHPLALETIQAGRTAEVQLAGIGAADRPWRLAVSPIGIAGTLVRLYDRSPLESAERTRTDFVANASHELRTPLATIIGYAETLAEPGAIGEEMRERFGATIQVEARRMLRIVEDLMSLSRIEAERYRAPGEQVDLGEVIRIAIDHAAGLAERRGCRIEAMIAADPPLMRGDFAQLLQLADNLIANAVRYGCTMTSCTIFVSLYVEGERLQLAVRDEGDGIAPEHLPRLTERFYRVDSARSRESGGTGLGLAIVKHIVERHRGVLDIRSTPGNGTEAIVTMPLS
ncbi:MAG: ATPase [Sphingomonas sp.]|uniref:ATP-binding protein n=1 Tax=Sphingomonas sp. TaxID=28214 RepID=UPI0017C1DC8A|nr:ATP-binding protein [Sphingomonas sp.]MBA3666603.1 ATPase [Sphingomonas sp.]